jgi:hypothetical protein
VIVAVFALLIGAAGQTDGLQDVDGIAIGKRVVAAVTGETDFQDSDFAKPLTQEDKTALRNFNQCGFERVIFRKTAFPKVVSVSNADPNEVKVWFVCKGVPASIPVGFSLLLRDGKIASVETHNAEYLRVE